MGRSLLAAFALCAFLFFSSCAWLTAPRVEWGPTPDPAALMKEVAARRESLTSLSGMARVRMDLRGEKSAFEQFFSVARPDKGRIEVLGLFDRTEALLAMHNGEVKIYLARDNRFFKGPANRSTLSFLAPLPFEPVDLVDLFMGLPPASRIDDPRLSKDAERGAWRVESWGDGPGWVFWFDPETLLPAGCARKFAPEAYIYEAAFNDYQPLGDTPLPRRLAVTWEGGRSSMDFKLYDLELNAPVPEEDFDLEPPPGVEVERFSGPD